MGTFIFTDITADILPERQYDDFEILPFAFSLDDDHYDNILTTLSAKDFYARMRAGAMSKTSMISQYLCEEKMRAQLEKGKDVLYLCFSSALSGSFNVATLVAKQLREEFPDRRVEAYDTRNASIGEGLFVDYVLKKRNSGVSFDELIAYCDSIVDNVCSYFTVDDLKHLARLGRVSKTTAFIGTLADIKPVLYVNKLGELIPITKVMSRKKALKALVDKMEEKMLPADRQEAVFIGHGDCYEDADFVRKLVTERLGIHNIYIGDIGPVIGAHTNAGVVALFFLGKDKVEGKDTHLTNLA